MTVQETLSAYAREFYPPTNVDLPEDAFAVFEDEVDVYGGCETCGPEYEYSVSIYWYVPDVKGPKYIGYRQYTGKFSDLLLRIQNWELSRS